MGYWVAQYVKSGSLMPDVSPQKPRSHKTAIPARRAKLVSVFVRMA